MDRIHQVNVPFSGSLELTHRCNLACRHCYQFPSRAGEPEMETGDWLRVIGELADCGCLFLAFTGGEPLLREDLRDVILAAAEFDFAITLQTNGTLLDEEMADFLAGIPTSRVDVSLYGAHPSTHDGLTGVEGSFAAAIRALELLSERGIPVLLKVVVGDYNLGELEGIASLADGLGLKAVFSSLIFPKNDGDPAPTGMRVDDAGLERFLRFETDYMLGKLAEILGREREEVGEDDLVDYVQRCAIGPDNGESGTRRYCGGGRTVFAINPYGDVYPCVAFPLVLGNLKEDNFSKVWKQSPELMELRLRESEPPRGCESCELLGKCAICRALAFLEEGDYMAFSRERCRQTRVLMKVLGDERA